MAINKRTFRNNLQYYMNVKGMPLEDAYQHVLHEGLDDSIANIPTQVSRLVNSGVPFEKALEIVEAATFDNNFDPYRAALQEYRNRQVYRSPEPNGRDRIDVDKIVRDTLSNKPELGNGYYPPMGMSTSPNSQHSQYSVVPKQPITEGMSPTPSQYPYELDYSEVNQNLAPEGYTPMPVSRNYTPIPTKYPYELGTKDNQDLAPEGKLGLPISGMYDESAVSADMNEPSGKVEVGPDTEVNPNTSVPTAESNTMKVYDTKTGTTNTYDSSTGELVSTSNAKSPSVNSVVKRVNTPKTQQRRVPAVTPTVTPAPINRPAMPAPNKTSLAAAYKRDLWNLINSKGISSPAEAVQRGIIPMEALNYI